MSTLAINAKQRHGTAIVEYTWRGTCGVLVLGDNQRHWRLPGGDADMEESCLAVAVRELRDWIGMCAYASVPLFIDEHDVQHQAFLLQTSGQPRMLRPGAITAIGLCTIHMQVKTMLQLPDFDASMLRISGSSDGIIRRFWHMKARSPLFFESLHTCWRDLNHLQLTGS